MNEATLFRTDQSIKYPAWNGYDGTRQFNSRLITTQVLLFFYQNIWFILNVHVLVTRYMYNAFKTIIAK